jgi:hypothetical protein
MKQFRRVLSLAMVVFGAPVAVGQTADVAAFESAYENCATTAARRYASGIDAADLIANVALDSCTSQRRSYGQALQRGGRDSTLVLKMIEQFDNDLSKKLKLLVLEARVKK